MNREKPSLNRLTNILSRYTQAYADEAFAEYQLSSGTYPFLLALRKKEGISQNQISKDLNVDKALSARNIKKLIESGYVRKEEDLNDSRAYKLYLTDKAKEVIPIILKTMDRWTDFITEGITEAEKEAVIDIMDRILENARKYKK